LESAKYWEKKADTSLGEARKDEISKYKSDGYSLTRQGLYKEAIKSFDKALALTDLKSASFTDTPDIYNEKGILYVYLKNFDEVNPKLDCVWNNKGNAAYELKKYDEAINYYDYALNGKAWVFANTNRIEEALPLIERSLEINPNISEALDTKGFILYKMGRYAEAINWYEKSLNINANDERVWPHKGSALRKLGNDRDAEKCFTKARQLKLHS
jgi:tetratricopeptide (TPR) repeat protein